MKRAIRLLTFCLCLFNYRQLLCMERELAAAVSQAAEDSKTAAQRWNEASCTVLNIERDLLLDADFNATGDKVITALRNKSAVVWRAGDGTCLYTLVVDVLHMNKFSGFFLVAPNSSLFTATSYISYDLYISMRRETPSLQLRDFHHDTFK